MKKVVTFGELMLRLAPNGYYRFFQNDQMQATFGGGEANVAVSLANYGMDAAFVTALPNNAIGEACRRDVRSFGVDVSNIKMTDGRMGIYFLETGSNQRPSKVVYDRADSAIAKAPIDLFDWEKIFEGADWFHISGISPAISASAAELSIAACKAAQKMGVTVSCDLNYRKNLWKYGKEAKEVMSEIAKHIDVAIANEEDFQKSLGITASSDVESGSLDRNVYEGIAKKAMELYPNIKRVAITLRESKSADRNDWAACIYDGKEFYVSRKYEITDIVDHVGGGDSFSGGLIYGLLTYEKQSDALEYAVAASCLKHTISGDYNRVTVAEVTSLMKGSGSGRVER